MARRRQGRPLQRVGAAAGNVNGLITDIRRFGIDVSIPSVSPLTFRVEIADREITDDEKQGALSFLMGLFGRKK